MIGREKNNMLSRFHLIPECHGQTDLLYQLYQYRGPREVTDGRVAGSQRGELLEFTP